MKKPGRIPLIFPFNAGNDSTGYTGNYKINTQD